MSITVNNNVNDKVKINWNIDNDFTTKLKNPIDLK